METPFQPQIDLDDIGPEVRSYIYQAMMDFQPFTTASTTVAVIAKDPLKLAKLEEYVDQDPQLLRKYWRISIALSEDGTQIEEEGVHEDIYVAIRLATDKLVKTLIEIQDEIISSQDRVIQIKTALDGTQKH
jgi:ribosome-associated translation inhibitor RaiA